MPSARRHFETLHFSRLDSGLGSSVLCCCRCDSPTEQRRSLLRDAGIGGGIGTSARSLSWADERGGEVCRGNGVLEVGGRWLVKATRRVGDHCDRGRQS